MGLAFDDEGLVAQATVGVLLSAVIASAVGWLVFTFAARVLGQRDAALPVHLADPVDPEVDHVRGDPDAPLPSARERHTVPAPASGVLTRLDAYGVRLAAWRLGAGRARKEDPVQAAAGVELHAKPGDRVTEGQPLLTLHTYTPDRFPAALVALAEEDAVRVERDVPEGDTGSVVFGRVTA